MDRKPSGRALLDHLPLFGLDWPCNTQIAVNEKNVIDD